MRTRCLLTLSLLLGFSLALTVPAAGQQILVQNGATVEVNNGGVWDLQGGTMDFGPAGATATLSEPSGGRVYNGLLTAVRALSNPTAADPAGLGIEITASNDLGDVTVTRGHAIQTASNGNESIERYYEISPSQNNSGLSAELTFSYTDAELNGLSESTLEFFKSEDGGSNWSEEGFDSRDGTANTVTLSGIASMSRWTLGSEASPLPVELVAFDGRAAEQGVRLTWRTASETNNAGFDVERQDPGAQAWTHVGFVEGKGTTSAASTYSFMDKDLPYEADSLTYRLKQMDLGEREHEYSAPVTVPLGVPDALTFRDSFPNPFSTQTTIRYELLRSTPVRLIVFDLLGRRVKTLVDAQQTAGRHQVRLSASDLASGTYLVRLSANRTAQTTRVTVAR
ncbi:T9SS type A sorting domain-containing protein [Salinibacter sp.]|uniref:T9SS type A sorting domain-containing protein n=1 Tax=Salinibacter sp. TaxID=2065818 RepID=UPI0021E8C1A8|nr:T9SS type A sorting domain-containing protein [Salinibacter sp.]